MLKKRTPPCTVYNYKVNDKHQMNCCRSLLLTSFHDKEQLLRDLEYGQITHAKHIATKMAFWQGFDVGHFITRLNQTTN